MKKTKMILRMIIATLISLSLFSCQEDTFDLESVKAPSDLTIEYEIIGQDGENPNGDGSGIAIINANAANAVTYYYIINGTKVQAVGGEIQQKFFIPGVNTYTIDAYAIGSGGTTISSSTTIDILSIFEAPQDIIDILQEIDEETGEVKPWRIKNEATNHFGLGPVGGLIQTEWWGAGPNDKVGTGMYDDRYTFNIDGTFVHETAGTIFGRGAYIDQIGNGSDDGTTTQEADILNYPLDSYTSEYFFTSYGDKGTGVLLSGTGFVGYYTGGNHIYEFYQYEDQPTGELILRTTDGNSQFDWWFIITNCDEGEVCSEPATIDVEYKNMVWSDEFDVDGTPDADNWNYNIGTGSNGWGNNELQYYTDRSDNVSVSEGKLKITAKKEDYQGSSYTSTRMKTEGLFEFTYGRVDISAKMPIGGGTWPALWMLGANIDTVGWPACGEIDILEHVGNDPGIIKHAIHTTSDSGDTQDKGESAVEGVSDDFHLYSINWSPDEINFLVDDKIIYTYENPTNSTTDDWPFDEDQFLIFNIAMGGTLGGDIDPAFTEATMEIDYVRVYQ